MKVTIGIHYPYRDVVDQDPSQNGNLTKKPRLKDQLLPNKMNPLTLLLAGSSTNMGRVYIKARSATLKNPAVHHVFEARNSQAFR